MKPQPALGGLQKLDAPVSISPGSIVMQAQHGAVAEAQPIRLGVRAATFGDVKAAFKDGLRDTWRRPGLSIFFGLVYALFGLALLAGFTVFDQI